MSCQKQQLEKYRDISYVTNILENTFTRKIDNNILEFCYLPSKSIDCLTIIFLHDGLGSITTWKDLPLIIKERTNCNILIYSRLGMGNSDPIKKPRKTNYMHLEATKTLPQICKMFNISKPILLGYSDGASIAIINAGSGFETKALILEAPHVNVEPLSVKGAKNALQYWENGDLKNKLSKHHKNVESAFKGWSNAWISKEFRKWNIEEFLNKIEVPILLLQGKEDEYGALKQIDKIKNTVRGYCKSVILDNCSHSLNKDRKETVINEISEFINFIK